MPGQTSRPRSARAPGRRARHILLDLTPLRRSRDYRALIAGLGVSVLGNQLTMVAVPFQVYAVTRSSLVVGLVSLAQLFPLIFGSLLGMELLPASNAIFQSLFQTGAIVGPAVAGLLLAGAGVHLIYWIDAVTFLIAMSAVLTMSPQPVPAAVEPGPGEPAPAQSRPAP